MICKNNDQKSLDIFPGFFGAFFNLNGELFPENASGFFVTNPLIQRKYSSYTSDIAGKQRLMAWEVVSV